MLLPDNRRTLVLIDAGFLLQVMRTYYGNVALNQLAIDHPRLIDHIRDKAEQLLDCPVLRIHWYDAVHPSNEIPNPVASAMERVAGVKVRKGSLTRRPNGEYQQKAVDTLIVRDMIVHAYRHVVSDMVLIAGDQDLTPGVDEAQEQGLTVHLWSITGEDLPPSVSRMLVSIADDHTELDATALAESVRYPGAVPVEQPAVSAPAQPSTPLSPTPDLAVPRPAPPRSAIGAPTVVPTQIPTARLYSTDTEAFTTLYDLNPNEYNAVTPSRAPAEVGGEYAGRWLRLADRSEIERIKARRNPAHGGNIPRVLDADLLAFGEDHGLDTWGPAYVKLNLRQGFWQGIAADGS